MTLTDRQRAIVVMIRRYFRATGEACPASFIARRLGLHHSTVQEHLSALHRKGILRGPNPPAMLAARMVNPANLAAPQVTRGQE